MLGSIVMLLAMTIFGIASFYFGVRYHELAKKGCRKIARKMHLCQRPPIDSKWTKITDEQERELQEAIRISFTGDLILLRDMVERAYRKDKNEYDFQEMFRFIKPFIGDADLSIGVFEGPMAGEEKGFSSSNYDDDIRLYINFPDSFGHAVKDAGYRLVTLANNHLLDKGLEGQERTLDILDSIGLDHVGSYRNQKEHDTIKIINVRGLRIAVLAYTYGCEYTQESFFFNEDTAFRTNSIVCRKSKYYKENRRRVIRDFEKARALNPDLIMVLPHIGKQFRHFPDRDQKRWSQLFIDQGADIIFSCHPHAVQPIEWRKNPNGKNVLLVHCPGNLINSYTDHDGDASMMLEAYLDSKTGEPFAVGCMPIYCYCNYLNGTYTALPVFSAKSVRALSCAEYKRICAVQKLVTKTALGVEIPIHNSQEWYVSFAKSGFVRNKVKPLEWRKEYNDSKLVSIIRDAKKVCFVGDSITDGMKNGGYGWYEPLMQMFPGVEVESFALGAKTSVYFEINKEQIAGLNADVYVIAVGCNDIRYRDPASCAMDEKVFVNNIKSICDTIRTNNREARLVLVSPWESLNPDRFCRVSVEEKNRLYKAYDEALHNYSLRIKAVYVNPNPYISKLLKDKPSYREDVFLDHIHPNADQGIRVFSEACILSS